MSRVVVVVNPAAGGWRTARVWRRLRDVVAAVLPAEHVETRGPGDGERLAREAALAGASLVVAVGGDGTLNEVVNGVRRAETATAVGAVLTGRGCDACRNFGVPHDPVAAVRAITEGAERRLDLGRAEWADGRRRWFAISCGAGFDAAVARRAAAFRARGAVSYVVAVFASLRAHRPATAALEVDGVRAPAAPITLAVAANAKYFGGGMKIAPDADPADGLLELVTVGDIGRLELLRWLPSLFTGGHLAHPRIHVRRARRITIDAPVPLPTHVDGEPIGNTPVVIAVEPGALRFRGPRGA